MSRPARKNTLWPLRLCIDQDQPAQTDPGRHVPSRGGKRYRVMILETENQQKFETMFPTVFNNLD